MLRLISIGAGYSSLTSKRYCVGHGVIRQLKFSNSSIHFVLQSWSSPSSMTSISSPLCTLLVIFLLAIITQASLLDPSQSDVSLLDRLRLEADLKNGASLLREILETKSANAQLQDLERLTEHYRSKRCRWKLCGTGRRFRFN
ncbi:hypothetical protein B9Z55_024664 [Caenorhabditis nigoni]|uniref:Uncharacterized protein n=1 Tax=Caenorhabditis nigoni TaxID=1611254 RepID=A0A2G5SV00_9PELO|nr:hypothetical protein B9Z55_024664 [Caenorhabditis nigoni]